MSKVKKNKKLPVHIVEQHNDVSLSFLKYCDLFFFKNSLISILSKYNSNTHYVDYTTNCWIIFFFYQVVPFIHRAIASKLLPFTGIPIIHLDSHPDLLIPINMQAELVFRPQSLFQYVFYTCYSLCLHDLLLYFENTKTVKFHTGNLYQNKRYK